MKRTLKIAMVLISLLIVILSIGFYRLQNTLSSENVCDGNVVEEKINSLGTHKAILFQYSCGAMDSFSTQVSVIEISHTFSMSPGNVFIAKGSNRRGDWGGPYTEIKWLTDKELQISYSEDADVFFKEDTVLSLKITYINLAVDKEIVEESVLNHFFREERFEPVQSERDLSLDELKKIGGGLN